jgi:hypothetical protein
VPLVEAEQGVIVRAEIPRNALTANSLIEHTAHPEAVPGEFLIACPGKIAK